MGLNFRKSLSIGKLFRINFSKSGIGVSAGVKGARISIGKKGIRETVSLPGTGLSWSEQQSFSKIKKAVTGKASEKAPAKPKKANKWLQWVWIAVVAGGFMLYQSGALDSAITGVKNAFTGKPAAPTASAVVEDKPVTPDKAEVVATVVAPSPAVSDSTANDAAAGAALPMDASGKRVLQMKDAQVSIAADTLYIASKSGSKFHLLDCSTVKSIASKNLVEYDSRDVAAAEKEPCSICEP